MADVPLPTHQRVDRPASFHATSRVTTLDYPATRTADALLRVPSAKVARYPFYRAVSTATATLHWRARWCA